MNHKFLIFINVILWSILGTCPTATAFQSNARNTNMDASATTSAHWPPRVYNENLNYNWILPAPSPFRKLSAAASLQRATNFAESPLRIERKLYPLLLHATPAAASNVMDLHNIDINPYAQSLNAEFEIAFATVASYDNSNKNNNTNINNHNNVLNNNNNNNYNNMAVKLPVAATNNLNVDQSPTGADSSDAALRSFDWHRYFAMADDNDDHITFNRQQQQQLASTANEVYQAKLNKVMKFH